ncbi:MAG: glycosyltransferase family 39 protein [Acidobacteriota bacterium]
MPTNKASNSAQTVNSQTATERTPLLVVLALALFLRLIVVWSVVANHPRGWLFGRGVEMGLLAKSLLAGLGLSSPFGVPTGPTAFIAPGYPILVAGIFRVFGIDSQTSEAVLMLINVAANLITIWLMMHLARRLFNRTAALLAGLFWAISPPLLWMPSIFWDTSICIALLLGLFTLALNCADRPSRRLWILIGAYSALTALITPALLLVILAVLCWTAWMTWRTQRLSIALALLTLAIVYSPWPIRNARVFHAFIPLRTTVGFELWMGNRPGATGFLDETIFPMYNQQELALYVQQGEVAYTQNKSDLAKQYILANPGIFLRMTAKRFFRFWSGTGNSSSSVFYLLHALITTLLGWLGLYFFFRDDRRRAILFALPLLLFPFPYYITHAEFRYRLIIDPLLTILAAFALTTLFQRKPTSESSPIQPD